MLTELNASGFDEATQEGVVLVDFWASYCAPCKKLLPELDTMSEEYSDVKFYKVDCSANMELAKSMGIKSLPAVFIYKNGIMMEQVANTNDTDNIRRAIDSYIQE